MAEDRDRRKIDDTDEIGRATDEDVTDTSDADEEFEDTEDLDEEDIEK
jgi:hypothetical protein